jgi:hypothetical protein
MRTPILRDRRASTRPLHSDSSADGFGVGDLLQLLRVAAARLVIRSADALPGR